MECRFCPRNCGVDRTVTKGFCGCGAEIEINRVSLHFGEEPCVSGKNGSGTVFFSGCNLGCVFCQNDTISRREQRERIPPKILSHEEFCELLLTIQKRGAENINLVTPTHFSVQIANALREVKSELQIPVIWNSSGYETSETLAALSDLIDIYLPDLKFFSEKNALTFASAPDYFPTAVKAISEMLRQQPEIIREGDKLVKGVLIRHLVLPGRVLESMRILDFIAEHFPETPVSLMCQYVPAGKAKNFPPLDRKLRYKEYSEVRKHFRALGLSGFFQEPESASSDYTPDFSDGGLLDSSKTSVDAL